MSEQPGRYQRSASGMIGAMLVLVLVTGAYVAFRALNRDDLSVEPERVDYREAVGFAQDAGWEVVYPAAVPDDWRATSVDTQREDDWGIGFLAPGGFAGVRQSDRPLDSLLETYVDERTEEQGSVRLDSEVATAWQSWKDAGGDTAYAADLDGTRVLVYGSAPQADLELLAESLTTRPISSP